MLLGKLPPPERFQGDRGNEQDGFNVRAYREDEDCEDEDTPHKPFCKMYHNFFFTFQAISFIHTSKICTVLTFSKMYESQKVIEYFLFYAQKPGARTFEIDYTNRSFGRLTLPGEPLEKKRYRIGEDGLPAVIFKETEKAPFGTRIFRWSSRYRCAQPLSPRFSCPGKSLGHAVLVAPGVCHSLG